MNSRCEAAVPPHHYKRTWTRCEKKRKGIMRFCRIHADGLEYGHEIMTWRDKQAEIARMEPECPI